MELERRSTWLVMGVFSSSNGVVISHPSSKTGLQSERMSQAEHPRDRSLAEVAAHRVEERRGRASLWSVALSELGAVDRAAYEAVTRTPTPSLDEPIRRLSNAANHSLLWLAIAALLALFGGERGRRAALDGVVAIGITSASVNLVTKSIVTRPRPERADPAPFAGREIEMPASPSFPSGHAASAFAFACAVGRHLRSSRSRSDSSPAPSRTRACTSVCITRGMSSLARSRGLGSPLWSLRPKMGSPRDADDRTADPVDDQVPHPRD